MRNSASFHLTSLACGFHPCGHQMAAGAPAIRSILEVGKKGKVQEQNVHTSWLGPVQDLLLMSHWLDLVP